MNDIIKDLPQRLRNKGTIIAVVSGVIITLQALGFKVDNEEVMAVVNALCAAGIALGILNNPAAGKSYSD